MNKKRTIICLITWAALCITCDKEQPIIEHKETVINYSINTTDVSNVGLFTAVLHGKINMPINEETEYTIGFQLSTDSLFSSEITHLCIADSITSDSTFLFSIVRGVGVDIDMPTLDPGTQYFVRSFIVLDDIGYIGNVKSFNTNQLEIITGAIDTISQTINYKVNLLEEDVWIDGFWGVCYGKTPDPTIDNNIISNDNDDIVLQEDGTYSVSIDFPIFGSTVYYRAYYYYNGKTYYGETRSTFMPYKYVNLGLSVNWATCNIGASTEYEMGGIYAWGETETKTVYSESTYKWYNGSYNTMTKYCNDIRYGNNGFTDTKTILDPEDDVAHVIWEDNWRMPTMQEQTELLRNCTWTWYNRGNTEYNGVAGFKVTSNIEGYSDRFIFLPADGYSSDTYPNSTPYCTYWSSSLTTDYPYSAYCLDSRSDVMQYNMVNRFKGVSVRPVCTSEEWLASTTIELSKTSKTLFLNKSYNLRAVVKHDGVVFDKKIEWTSDNPSVATVDENGTVQALSKGTAHIIASYSTLTSKCEIVVVLEESEVEHGYVDLGLSVKWATFNVGATSPEDYGYLYAWGETETKSTYTWSTYKWCNGSSSTLTKYCVDGEYGNDGFTDIKTTLDPEDDVAHVKWGGNWRMPTKAEQDELLNNCTWTWCGRGNTEFNGVLGYKVTSNKEGYTDRFIFLPAAGCNSEGFYVIGRYGYYWSGSLYTDGSDKAYYIGFASAKGLGAGNYNRDNGLSVRPVCP